MKEGGKVVSAQRAEACQCVSLHLMNAVPVLIDTALHICEVISGWLDILNALPSHTHRQLLLTALIAHGTVHPQPCLLDCLQSSSQTS